MRGTAYAITEIVVFLAIATFIGIAIGWVLSKARTAPVRTVPAATTPPKRSGDAGRTKELEERIQRLESEKAEMAASAATVSPDVAELRKELAQAQWQIKTLEDALAGEGPGEV